MCRDAELKSGARRPVSGSAKSTAPPLDALHVGQVQARLSIVVRTPRGLGEAVVTIERGVAGDFGGIGSIRKGRRGGREPRREVSAGSALPTLECGRLSRCVERVTRKVV